MIDATLEAQFPNNVVSLLAVALPQVDPDAQVFTRPLRPTDPNYSIGVYGALWTPDEESQEMGNLFNESTLQQYQLGIQTLIKDGEPERGLAVSSIFNTRVRRMLYRDEPLRVALGSLYVEDISYRESMRRWGVRTQRFMSNDIEGQFVYISVLDFWIETEVI